MARAQKARKNAPVPNKMTKKQMKRKKPIDESTFHKSNFN